MLWHVIKTFPKIKCEQCNYEKRVSTREFLDHVSVTRVEKFIRAIICYNLVCTSLNSECNVTKKVVIIKWHVVYIEKWFADMYSVVCM